MVSLVSGPSTFMAYLHLNDLSKHYYEYWAWKMYPAFVRFHIEIINIKPFWIPTQNKVRGNCNIE